MENKTEIRRMKSVAEIGATIRRIRKEQGVSRGDWSALHFRA